VGGRSSDPAEALVGLILLFGLLYLLIMLGVLLLTTAALLLIGWYLTLLLVTNLDRATDGRLLSDHSALVLILSGGVWTIAAFLIPAHWLLALHELWPGMEHYPYLVPTVGGMIGLSLGLLVLFATGSNDNADVLDLSGMYSIAEPDLLAGDTDATGLLTDGILLGQDIE
jgi:hypothetical protein